jgi:quercetin dioxygenase-like cupin family protein
MIRLQFDRIPPGARVGPHQHDVETVVYLAAGQIVYRYGDGLAHEVVVEAGDVLYEAPAARHVVENHGRIDALALLAAVEPRPGGRESQGSAEPGDQPPVRRGALARVRQNGGVEHRLIAPPGAFGTPTFAIAEVTVAPGVTTEWHRHPAAEHVLVVFEGRGEITVDQVTETLEPLTGIRIRPGAIHQVRNPGRWPLRYLVCASPGMDPLVDRQIAQAPRRRSGA